MSTLPNHSLLPIAVFAAAGATALATEAWAVIPVGAAAAAICFLAAARPSTIPAGFDVAHRLAASRLVAAEFELRRALQQAPRAVREFLSVSEQGVLGVTRNALALLAQHQELGNHLASRDPDGECADREALNRRAREEDHAEGRERFRRALAAKDAALAERAELRRSMARLEADLTGVHARFEALTSQLLRLKSAQPNATLLGESGQLARTLGALTEEIDAISKSVEHTVNPGTEEGT